METFFMKQTCVEQFSQTLETLDVSNNRLGTSGELSMEDKNVPPNLFQFFEKGAFPNLRVVDMSSNQIDKLVVLNNLFSSISLNNGTLVVGDNPIAKFTMFGMVSTSCFLYFT